MKTKVKTVFILPAYVLLSYLLFACNPLTANQLGQNPKWAESPQSSKESQFSNISGNKKSNSGDLQGAISDFDRAISLTPNFWKPYYNRGLAKYQMKNHQAAISDYSRAIALKPDLTDAYYNRGVAKYEMRDRLGAIADYDKVISIDPKFIEAYQNRGYSKQELKDYQGAIADYDRAIAIDPSYAAAYGNRGSIKLKLGNRREAVVDLTKASELFRKQNLIKDYQRMIKLLSQIKA